MAGKVRYNELSDLEKKKYLGEFYSMVALLRGRDEVKNFFKDLLTLSEVVMISRRIQIAKMLMEGYKHEEIKKKLKIGYATIGYVERWLNEGFGGYKKIIKKYNDKYKEKDNFEKYGYEPLTKEWIRKKYPAHYLLSNLIRGKIKI
ncbi:MAG: YerC/YecD family TrpR-related protein [bacterium]|nr:YerC/YecD family TrpR-related protein [bacterium]